MDYLKKDNSIMMIVMHPTTNEEQLNNINAAMRVIETGGGKIIDPGKKLKNEYYGMIRKAEKERAARIKAERKEAIRYSLMELELAEEREEAAFQEMLNKAFPM